MNLINLKLLKKQNARMQEQLYKQYAALVFNLIYRYVKNEAVAGELVNDVFFKVFRKVESFDENTSKFLAWIKRIAVNESLQYLRKQKSLIFQDFESFEKEGEPNDFEVQADLEYYYQLILSLPEAYRVVFNLYAVEGYSHKEIAEQLNIAESTSRSSLLRARKLIKEKLVL